MGRDTRNADVKWTQRLVSTLSLLLILAPGSGNAEEPPASVVVGELHTVLIQSMQQADSLGYQGRYDKIAPVLSETFDIEFMAEKSVGRHWKRLGEEEKQRWRDTFARLTTANYAGRFNAFSGQSFETMGEEPAAHGTMVVRTKLVLPDDDDVQLNYRLRETENGWRIVDVYLNGTVSELALRRSEYSAVLKREGFETLLAQLGQKADDLANGTIQ
jgi:phospholipid transport system substrate-binding protein